MLTVSKFGIPLLSMWIFGVVAPGSLQTKPASRAELDKETDAVISSVGSWLDRGIEVYGQARAELWPSDASIEREVNIYRLRKEAGLISSISDRDRSLSFNLLLHRPSVGREYFDLRFSSSELEARRMFSLLIPELPASDEWGELRALAGLNEKNVERRRVWAQYLDLFVIYPSSRVPIETKIKDENDDQTTRFLLRSLSLLGMRESLGFIRKIFETTKSDERRAAALFAMVEIMGNELLPELEQMHAEGPKTVAERDLGLKYLRERTSKDNPHGIIAIENDNLFLGRFGDLYSNPTMRWLKTRRHLLDEKAKLSDSEKSALFDTLEEGFGYGFPAVRGTLSRSVNMSDLPRLRKLRALMFYRSTTFTVEDAKTLLKIIRSLTLK
ncbi:MAG: hypothetical protein HY286_19190 [Planctomycetes bacterium]|nr:hypothetical protein [Planctomycetota bacterium]